jgi:hypothetical protein
MSVPSLRLIQGVEILAQSCDDTFILVGVLPEDVLDDHNCLLHNIIDLGLNQIEQS